jgi:glycosyltransferase involved in cell wall biosynthesis
MISILIPIYNTPIKFIKECFSSIEKQTYKEYEVIIVNDGSNKKVTNYLNKVKKENWHVYHVEKSGISKALNFGLSKCKYNLVARMDSDDIMLENRLEKQMDFINKNEVDILGSQIESFGFYTGTTQHPYQVNKDIIIDLKWFLNHPSVLYKKDKIIALGGYNSNFDGLEDLELWCRCLLSNYKIINMEDVLVKYRTSEIKICKDKMKKIKFVQEFYSNKLFNQIF